MVDKTIETANHDDGAELVKEVLEQNPPEEQGIRDEWDSHIGWHRQENILGGHANGRANHKTALLLRGSYNKPTETVKHDPQDRHQIPLIADANNNNNNNNNTHGRFTFTSLTNPFHIGGVIVIALLLRLTHSRLRLSRGQKER